MSATPTDSLSDISQIVRMPKADLHAHLILSCPFDFFKKISEKETTSRLIQQQKFSGLDAFLSYVDQQLIPLINSKDKLLALFIAAIEQMVLDRVTYTEISFDLHFSLICQQDWRSLAKDFAQIIQDYSNKIEIAAELGFARRTQEKFWRDNYAAALETGLFKSIDLYGAEDYLPVTHFKEYFDFARKLGLKIKFHCGEISSSERMQAEIDFVQPNAIQHGINAVNNQQLLKDLAQSKIQVNVCPWSNYCLSLVEEYKKHPIRQMYDAGLRVTINSDDFAVFQRSLSQEYQQLYANGVFNLEELDQIRKNGFRK